MLIPAMQEEGYDHDFATAVPVAASVVGPIIPPSNIMIIYAMTTNASVGAMFLGGILPGIMIGVMLMVFTYYLSVKRNYPKNTDPRPPVMVMLRTAFMAVPVLVMPLIIMVGVLSGAFTASESGNVAAVYALFLSVFVFKDYGFKELYRIFVNAAVTVSTCLLVLSTATGLAWILAVNQIPQALLTAITSLTSDPYIFLLLVNIALLCAGMFLDPGAAIILLAPVLATMGMAYGIHPLHLSMVVCLNLTLGVVTPPVGVCLYVGAGIGKVSIDRLVRQMLPFVLLEFVAVLLVTYFPPISTTIPRWFGLY
jgi:tripartite ATP-independent transporter DctM subunit